MKRYTTLFIGICLALLCATSCSEPESKTIIGRWQSEEKWFEFNTDGTYNGGQYIITEVKGYNYVLDEKAHELNLYTGKDDEIYYLHYEFKHPDTLILRNKLNTNQQSATYVRVVKK
jgi:hypothetical protein